MTKSRTHRGTRRREERGAIRPQPIGDTLSRCFWCLPLSVLAGTNGRERATVALRKTGARSHGLHEAQPRCNHQPHVQKL